MFAYLRSHWPLILGVAGLAIMVFAWSADASPRRLEIAKQYVGLKEGTRRANKAMGLDTRRTPWCGRFAYVVAKRTGTAIPAQHLRAISWARAGKRIKRSQIRAGDWLIIRTRFGHHVTVFSRKHRGRYCGIGGNQSNGVKESCYRAGSVKAVVR